MSAGNTRWVPQLPFSESLRVEFKSDRTRLPDDRRVG